LPGAIVLDVAQRFAAAAQDYEQHADIQKQAAELFDAWLAQQDLPVPARIAEIGCGTGFLTRLLHRRFPAADLLATDLAPAMVESCRAALPLSARLRYRVCDGRETVFDPVPDWIVSAMCFQWFDPLLSVIEHHAEQAGVLAFSIVLDGSFSEWREAHARAGLAPGLRAFPDYAALLQACAGLGKLSAQRLSLSEHHADGLSFARGLRAIGADRPHEAHAPINLRRALRYLEQGCTANYEIGFFCIVR
jgi:malonyl-CoA O-methyltransferase